jgi:hypothetical protein
MENSETDKDNNKGINNNFLNKKNKDTAEPNTINPISNDNSKPDDLIDDLKKGKIDPLTEGKTNLGYEERAPRKKELEEKEHKDREDK